jgi:hypothetical protein
VPVEVLAFHAVSSPWYAWCGERIAVAVLIAGVVYHLACWRRRAALVGHHG